MYDSYDWSTQVLHDDANRVDDHPCAFAGYVEAEIERCLSPPRGGDFPTAALFLVGDSHCLSVLPAFNRAVAGRMSLAPACVSGQPFGAGYEYTDIGSAILRALTANVHAGDVVAVLNLAATNDYDWLESQLVHGLLRPRGASLLLLGDYPRLTGKTLYTGMGSPVPVDDSKLDALLLAEAAAANFSSLHPAVFAFPQLRLWLSEDGRGGNNWIPGTSMNAYLDDNHLTVDGSRYLAPYLCSALEGWGLFGSSSTATLATADWKDHVRSSNDQLLEGLRVQCYMLHAWGGVPLDFEGGYIRLHPCENLTLDYIRTYDACPACPEWLSHGWDSVDELRGPA